MAQVRSIATLALPAAALLALANLHAQQVNPSLFGDLHWRNIGPPRSGYVSSPAGVPGDPTTYYAGMPEGGVWKTTNGGVTWKPIFDDVHVASVGAVAVAPSDPKVVYVGTGNQSGLVVHDWQRRLQIDRQRQVLDERRPRRLPIHRRHRRRSP